MGVAALVVAYGFYITGRDKPRADSVRGGTGNEAADKAQNDSLMAVQGKRNPRA